MPGPSPDTSWNIGTGPPAPTYNAPAPNPGTTGGGQSYTASSPAASNNPGLPSDVQAELDRMAQLGFPGLSHGQAAPQWAIQFAEDELDAQNAGDVWGATLSGFRFPSNVSVSDFSAIEALAHQFAADSNWRYMPTGKMILDAYNSHITDKNQAFSMWFGRLGASDQQAVPWLQFGQNAQAYQGMQDNLQIVMDKLTGSQDLSQMPPDMMTRAMKENWSSAKLESQLRATLGATSPWLQEKYGYDYKTWQTYKTDHRQDVIQRYGIDKANQDQLYLQAQDNPLATGEAARGAQTEYASSQNQSTFYSKTSALDYGSNTVR